MLYSAFLRQFFISSLVQEIENPFCFFSPCPPTDIVHPSSFLTPGEFQSVFVSPAFCAVSITELFISRLLESFRLLKDGHGGTKVRTVLMFFCLLSQPAQLFLIQDFMITSLIFDHGNILQWISYVLTTRFMTICSVETLKLAEILYCWMQILLICINYKVNWF